MRAKWIIGTAAVAALASACSSSGGSGGGSQAAGGSGSTITITVHNNRLTAPNGHTLYYNSVDTATKITCTGACTAEWPPLTGTPKAGNGVKQSALATATRSDGSKQITYNGHPLYQFADDKSAGDAKGNGLSDEGGRWMAAPAQANSAVSPPMSSAGSGGY